MSGLAHGSIWIVLAWLAAGGLGAPLPEDVALIAAGALIERGAIGPIAAFAIVMLGVLGGDAVLFFGARRLGPAALTRRPFARLLPPDRRAKLAHMYERRGGLLVFVARNVAGLRAAAFAMAGIAGMRPRRFLLWDAIAACVGVPIWMAIGYAGAHHLETAHATTTAIQRGVLVAVLALAMVGLMVSWVRARRARTLARPAVP
jgi:membrane protein DedA with SNARE-associated domain